MAIDRNITININDTSPLANTAYVDLGKENKVYNKAQVNELVEDLREGALGSILPSQNLEELNALEDGNYYAAEAGTYAFGVTVPNGWQYRFNKVGNIWKTLTKVQTPMQDLTSLENRVTENENKVDDFIENYAVEIDQEFNENSTNAIANDVVSKRTSLLEKLENEATEIIEGEGVVSYTAQYSKFNTDYSIYRKGNGELSSGNIYIPSSASTIVFQDIPIQENTRVRVKLSNQVSSSKGVAFLLARDKISGLWKTLINEKVSTSTSIAEAIMSFADYDKYSLMAYKDSTVFLLEIEDLTNVKTSFDKDYLYNKLNQSGSYANPIGKLVDITTISLPSGYTTFYYPWIITTENIENPKGKYYLYFSTDHAGNAGKIGMFYSDNLIDWTFYGTVIQASTFGWVNAECETPTVLWIEEVKKFYCYFQTTPSRGGLGYAQATQIAESADGITWTWVKEAFNITMNKMKGDGHNGYFVCQKINGIYKGVSLFGGTDIDFRATHFSKDGLNWITHQKEAQAVYTSSFFWRENSLCKVSNYDIVSESGAGGVAGSYKKFILSYVDEDLEVIGQGDVLGNIIPSGEGQVVSSLATNVIEGQVYLSAVFSKNKIVIKKIV